MVKHPRVHRCVIQPYSICSLICKEIKEHAWVKAKLNYLDGNYGCVPPPIAPIDVSGQYIFLPRADVKWMSKDLIEYPHACSQYMHKMLIDETLRVKIGSAFGQWYFYSNLVCNSFAIHCHSSFLIALCL